VADDLGDQSEATLTRGTDSVGDYQSLDVALQLDNLVAGVTVRDYRGNTPEYDQTQEALIELLQDRVEAVLDGAARG
jgi:hypothetical protein